MSAQVRVCLGCMMGTHKPSDHPEPPDLSTVADIRLALALLRDTLRFAQSKSRPYCDASVLAADLEAAIVALESQGSST
mgnify:CR=1 FL=1